MDNESTPSSNPRTTRIRMLLTGAILLILVDYLITTWITIVQEHYVVKWQHVTAALLFLPLPILLFKNYKAAVFGTGIYLLIGLFNGLSLTAALDTGSFTMGELTISGFNWFALELLVLFAILHMV